MLYPKNQFKLMGNMLVMKDIKLVIFDINHTGKSIPILSLSKL